MSDRQAKLLTLRRKPAELLAQENPNLPNARVYAGFKLPKRTGLYHLKDIAETISLSELGVIVPACKYPDRFEAGFRYGLARNRRTDVKTHFRPLFSMGFCWAKIFYRKFDPRHPLAASGSFKGKITAKP